jgi:signal transduction histidine kinase
VSRFELGNFQAEYQTVNLPQLIADVMGELAEKVKYKKLQLHTDYDPEIINIVSDPNLLRMIVTNLCSNAVKYSPDGGKIQVVYKQENGLLKLEVADSGMGIPAQDQDQIFSKLFRASNAARDVPDGTGLGLYIVREAVSVLRGKISFTSTEGNGAVFTVQIPLEAAE